MSIALSEDHRSLADTVRSFLSNSGSRAANRALLEAGEAPLPSFFSDFAELGMLGLHIGEAHGGSGYSLEEAVVVAEELGRAITPGPFVPTMVASAAIAQCDNDALAALWLPGLSNGTVVGAVGLDATAEALDGALSGDGGVIISAADADVLLVVVGSNVAVVAADAAGITLETPRNLDPARRASRVSFQATPCTLLPGAAATLVACARLLFAAEAVGVARETTEMAAEYAKQRIQFGRPIATFQAVKHHCANMLVATELATGAVWDAARAANTGGDQFGFAAAMAATLAISAADLCAQLNIQVHGGIGFTWEHDAHLFLRRAAATEAVIDPQAAARSTCDLVRRGVARERNIDLPPEAEAIRDEVRSFASTLTGLDAKQQLLQMIDDRYAMPHWPAPWGRDAKAVEQLVIEQEFAAAGVKRPQYGITGWVILTLIQHATADQVARWVSPALRQDLIWCQLFSEPDAGSDAAGVKTRATRVDGGWKITGQKVWTSGAHQASFGLATVRTNPDVAKHAGITMMVIDMHADGVEVRPLRQPNGSSEFNEVFFDDVFIPDDDVVGPVDGGWTVARATLGNESVSIGGGGGGGLTVPAAVLIESFDRHPQRLDGGEARIGRYIAGNEAMKVLNLRSAHRAVAGSGPGPEGNVTKLVLSELGHEATAISAALAGAQGALLAGEGEMSGFLVLTHRAMSIAGGTSEIKRNQIGERILGLPRDPLIK